MVRSIENEELIRLYTQPGQGYTDQELADRLGVDRTAIYKRRIKLEAEYPFDQPERGRYKIDRTRLISQIGVSQNEALILYLATRRLSRNTRLAKKHVQNALEKLALALYKPMNERLVKAAANVSGHPDAARREAILETLVRGWGEQTKVHLRYQGLRSSKTTNHTICPYLIEPSPWSDSVYVIGKTNVWDAVTPFQLERIEKAILSTETFEIDTTFEEETLFKYAWGIWSSDKEPEQVRLKFTGQEAIRRLKESMWHPEEKITGPDEYGHVTWSAPIAEWQEMIPWIRGWGADCEVLEPVALRETLMGEAKAMAEKYGWFVSSQANEQKRSTLDDFFGD
jgi:predicted DNA-binding transcriptional regulator YafY